jgi:REP element-mobilizing transposase RayT
MTRPRSTLVSLEATPYYHCISRCVRRSFLCGKDRFTGKSFDHRKPWLVERMALLTEVFAVDIAAYAVMSNHYHLVLYVNVARASAWSDNEVMQRWTRIFKGPKLVQQHLAGASLNTFEKVQLQQIITHLRAKLASLSKFMSCMNYYIACKANSEDGCTGRFWEGRFKSQALLDEAAMLSCMAYVDLNPVRAGIASNLKDSNFTSIQDRIRQLQQVTQGNKELSKNSQTFPKPRLMPFSEKLHHSDPFTTIPYNLKDYLQLTDWTGRLVRPHKKASIPQGTPTLLAALGLSESQWSLLTLQIQKQSICMFNGLERLAQFEKRVAKHRAA